MNQAKKTQPQVTEHWRPSASLKRRCARTDRYYKKCQRLANGHHCDPPFMKHYQWLIRQDCR